ncbi:restriction endonuclease subunit S [Micromonospora chokoriensis]|uniref:restriction endonuclease subunit S n=1 Tax=Micromonospora chokoriensis TaxID=356851 RepID=UPI0012FD3C70|nr:restriction endonuclease subunit S [Micromonospora chokoriensis]
MTAYLRAANVKDGALDLSDVLEMNFDPGEQVVFRLLPGDVLMTEGSGSRSVVGSSAVWQGEIPGTVCFQNTLLRLRPRSDVVDGRYLAWWARGAHSSGLLASIAGGANIFHLGADRVRQLPFQLPPLDEQKRIVAELDEQIREIDAHAALRRRQVELLAEKRRSVIAAATGMSDSD